MLHATGNVLLEDGCQVEAHVVQEPGSPTASLANSMGTSDADSHASELSSSDDLNSTQNAPSSEQSQDPSPPRCAAEHLEERLLGWRHTTVHQVTMFRETLKEIPSTFPSAAEYGRFFSPHVWENVRADVAQGFDLIGRQPRYKVRLLRLDPGNGAQLHDMIHFEVMNVWDDLPSVPGSICKATDVIIIANRMLRHREDFDSAGLLYCMAVGKHPEKEEGGGGTFDTSGKHVPSPFRKATLLLRCDGDRFAAAFAGATDLNEFWYAHIISSLATPGRMVNALAAIENPGSPASQSPLLLSLLCRNARPKAASLAVGQTAAKLDKWQYASVNAVCAVATAAKEATAAAAAAGEAAQGFTPGLPAHPSSIQLVQGPPGTGKTSTIVQLLLGLVRRGHRVLMCAPTNVAVQGVASRLLEVIAEHPGHRKQWSASSMYFNPNNVALVTTSEGVDPGSPLATVEAHERIIHGFSWAVKLEQSWSTNLAELLRAPMLEYHPAGGLTMRAWLAMVLDAQLGDVRRMHKKMLECLPTRCRNKEWGDHVTTTLGQLSHLLEQVRHLSDTQFDSVFAAAMPLGHQQQQVQPAAAAVAKIRKKLLLRLSQTPQPVLPEFELPVDRRVSTLQLWLVRSAQIVMCTVSKVGSTALSRGPPTATSKFDICVVDEAGQLSEAEMSIVLARCPDLPVLALVGDQKQLAAIAKSRKSARQGYRRSLLERLLKFPEYPQHLLKTQYRMKPHISQFPNSQFYGGQVHDDKSVQKSTYGAHVRHLLSDLARPLGLPPFCFINVRGSEDALPWDSSLYNIKEAEVVCGLVQRLMTRQAANSTAPPLSIGIISPYAQQVKEIATRLGLVSVSVGKAVPASGGVTEVVRAYVNATLPVHGGAAGRQAPIPVEKHLHIEARSVDGFQGREMDVIILSLVRSNRNGCIGFLDDEGRINVSLTRARHQVFVVGNADTLSNDATWLELVLSAQDPGRKPRAFWEEKDIKLPDTYPPGGNRQHGAPLAQPPAPLPEDKACWKGLKFLEDDTYRLNLAKLRRLKYGWYKQVVNEALRLAQGQQMKRWPGHTSPGAAPAELEGLVHYEDIARTGYCLVWCVDLDVEEHCQVLHISNIVQSSGVMQAMQNVYNNRFRSYTNLRKQSCREIPADIWQTVSNGKATRKVPPMTWPLEVRIS